MFCIVLQHCCVTHELISYQKVDKSQSDAWTSVGDNFPFAVGFIRVTRGKPRTLDYTRVSCQISTTLSWKRRKKKYKPGCCCFSGLIKLTIIFLTKCFFFTLKGEKNQQLSGSVAVAVLQIVSQHVAFTNVIIKYYYCSCLVHSFDKNRAKTITNNYSLKVLQAQLLHSVRLLSGSGQCKKFLFGVPCGNHESIFVGIVWVSNIP